MPGSLRGEISTDLGDRGCIWDVRAWTSPAPDDPVMSEIVVDDGRYREGSPSHAFVDHGLAYIRSGDGFEELYQLVHDPLETKNRAGETTHRTRLARLRVLADQLPGAEMSRTPSMPLASAGHGPNIGASEPEDSAIGRQVADGE
jgi:hypothetical protein